jgi:hypothetical protein
MSTPRPWGGRARTLEPMNEWVIVVIGAAIVIGVAILLIRALGRR